jgi:hypothetical protein
MRTPIDSMKPPTGPGRTQYGCHKHRLSQNDESYRYGEECRELLTCESSKRSRTRILSSCLEYSL